jgi:hypothetical protein
MLKQVVHIKPLGSKGEGIPRKLATATQPQFPGKISDFKQVSKIAGEY